MGTARARSGLSPSVKPVEADGLFYRLIVRLHRHSLGRDDFQASRHWQKGLVLKDQHGNRALLEYVDHDVHVRVRGVYPPVFLHQLTSMVKDIVEEFWPGLLCRIMVPCRSSCGLKRPGHGRFELSKLIESLAKNRPDFPCKAPNCEEWQPIAELMHNAPAPSASDAALHEKLDRILTNTESLPILQAQVAEKFTELYQRLDDDGKHGPRLFSMSFLDPGFLDRPDWLATKVRITLWCEHAQVPLCLLDNQPWKPGSAGVYAFDMPRQWVTQVAPVARIIGRTLGLGVRVATAGLAAGTNIDAYANELGFGEKSVEAMTKLVDYADAWQQGARRGPRDAAQDEPLFAEGAALRAFQDFVRKQDPSFGGLERVWDQQTGRYIWVHRRYRDIYAPPLRGLAADDD